jgi:hypothetical protein
MRSKIEEALSLIEKDLGVRFRIGNAKYDSSTATFKLEVMDVVNGTVVTPEAEAFKRNAQFLGMEPCDLGKSFESNGRTFKVIGLRSGRSTKPVICTCGGKEYVFKTDTVRIALGHRRPESQVLELLKFINKDINDLTTRQDIGFRFKDMQELQRERMLLIRELGRTPTVEELAGAKTHLDKVRD